MDHPLPVPSQIGRALPRTGGGIDVCGKGAHGLRTAEKVAVRGFTDHDIRGREVGEDQRPPKCGIRRRRRGRPEVFADLSMEDQAGQIRRLKNQIIAKGHPAARDGDLSPGVPAMGEPAFLIELTVIRQVGLWHNAQHLPARDHDSAIIEPPLPAQRRAEQDHRCHLGTGFNEHAKRLFHRI